MNRDPRIEAIGQAMCQDCREKVEQYMRRDPLAGKGTVTVYVLRTVCNKCKQAILRGAAAVQGR